ncbi:hypothetical protein BC830DRAFT_1082924 [Chytriomyces sp. MP71]|nr:hypothetical protein BC830DRAFT_1082924 [Chytriomyces sp. MP71]
MLVFKRQAMEGVESPDPNGASGGTRGDQTFSAWKRKRQRRNLSESDTKGLAPDPPAAARRPSSSHWAAQSPAHRSTGLAAAPVQTGASDDALVWLLDRYASERNDGERNPDSESESSRDDQDLDAESARSRLRSRKRDAKFTEKQVDSFLMLLAISRQEYGCPTAVLEVHLNVFNGYAFASWKKKDGSARTQLFGDWSIMEVYKRQLSDEIARHVASYSKPEVNPASRSRTLFLVVSASLREGADTQAPTLSVRKTWARTLLRYLGGTLCGVKLNLIEEGVEAAHTHLDSTVDSNMDGTPEMEKGAITQSQLAEQILYLASAEPGVQTQIQEALRKQN